MYRVYQYVYISLYTLIYSHDNLTPSILKTDISVDFTDRFITGPSWTGQTWCREIETYLEKGGAGLEYWYCGFGCILDDNACFCMYMYNYVYTSIHPSMHPSIHTYIHTCNIIHAHMYRYNWIVAYIYAYIYTCVWVCLNIQNGTYADMAKTNIKGNVAERNFFCGSLTPKW